MQKSNKARVKADLLINPIGELATCSPTNAPLRGKAMGEILRQKDAAIACAQGKIIACGERSQVLAQIIVDDQTKCIDAGHSLVTPGLIDVHTHLVFAGNRADEFIMRCQGKTYEQIAALGGGIVASVLPTRQASFEQLVELGSVRLRRLLAHGTTTCEIKTGYGLDMASELKLLAVIERLQEVQPVEIVPTFMPAHAVPKGKVKGEYVEEILEVMLPQLAAQREKQSRKIERNMDWEPSGAPLLEPRCFVDVFCDPGYFSVEDCRRILTRASALGLAPRIHADEFANLGASKLAVEIGAFSADHLLKISNQEMKLLASSNTAAVVLPGTSFYLNLKEYAPARQMIEQGVWLCLASDFNPGSCHIFSLPMIFGLSCLNLRLTAEEALCALTVNPAFLLGKGGQLGQIRQGYRADITIFDVACLEEIAYNIGWNPVKQTIKSGKVVYGA